MVFHDKKIQGLADEGNHDTLQFENEHIGDIIESDEDESSHRKSASVDVTSLMDNPQSSMDNILVNRHTSADNPSTDKSSSRNLNSFRRSMNLWELLKVRDHTLIKKYL